ncbi:MAG: 2-C-methyl-D-erythritol 2,4-cyclodiphosphate synthase [Actinomycetota bacterium]
MRTGIGFDVHAFDETRPLVLAGVTIDNAIGLAGWSDADVVSHAIADALLGAAGLGDLGTHFPEEAVAEGSSSLEMLTHTANLLQVGGYEVVNIDTVVMIQDIKIAPYRTIMAERVADALGIDAEKVSIKATTTDRLGFVGRQEGAAALAIVLVDSVRLDAVQL